MASPTTEKYSFSENQLSPEPAFSNKILCLAKPNKLKIITLDSSG